MFSLVEKVTLQVKRGEKDRVKVVTDVLVF